MATTRQLHLLRHAKSSWDDPSLPDRERPLAERGRQATKLLRDHFRKLRLSVELVLCSPAVRARQTWERVSEGIGGSPDVRYVPAIYAAGPLELLDVLHQVGEKTTSVLLVGHNPGMELLLAELTGAADSVPTGAFASLDVTANWADLGPGSARLRSLVRPRELG